MSEQAAERIAVEILSGFAEAYPEGAGLAVLKLTREIERLRAAYLRDIQLNNECEPTMRPCSEKCGCQMEMERAVNAANRAIEEGM